jgi:histidine ammonia-lyase
MSISASALSAEALKETMPAASFSRSCESHNQDKVSLGTIAPRSADRVCTLVERVTAIHLLAASQACELRGNLLTRPKLISLITNIRSFSKKLIQDRPMDKDIESVKGAIANSELFSNILRQLKSRDRHEPRK